MPILHWETKSSPEPIPAALYSDSIIYPHGLGYPDQVAQDQLIWGDNLAIMWALLPDYEGQFDLIYADPPFFTNRRYPARIGRGEDSRKPAEWKLAEGYPDHWPNLEAYLDMLYPRLKLIYRLLKPTGTFYLHLDWHADAYARLLLDEIFGAERLLNQIAWVYHGPSPIRTAYNRKHDTILVYTKSPDYTFNVDAIRQPYDPSTVKTFASSPKAGFGKVPNLARGKVPEDWWYFPVVARLHNERTGYPTQKPEALLERVILASSNSGDLVGDFFCGSGTTPLVANRLGRRFLASDISWRAIHTTRTRLLRDACSPFALQIESAQMETWRTMLAATSQKLSLFHQNDNIYLKEQDLDALDYWEVDPAWDGKLFRSAAQALRPLRDGCVPAQLKLPIDLTNSGCLRLVDNAGNISAIPLSER